MEKLKIPPTISKTDKVLYNAVKLKELIDRVGDSDVDINKDDTEFIETISVQFMDEEFCKKFELLFPELITRINNCSNSNISIIWHKSNVNYFIATFNSLMNRLCNMEINITDTDIRTAEKISCGLMDNYNKPGYIDLYKELYKNYSTLQATYLHVKNIFDKRRTAISRIIAVLTMHHIKNYFEWRGFLDDRGNNKLGVK